MQRAQQTEALCKPETISHMSRNGAEHMSTPTPEEGVASTPGVIVNWHDTSAVCQHHWAIEAIHALDSSVPQVLSDGACVFQLDDLREAGKTVAACRFTA